MGNTVTKESSGYTSDVNNEHESANGSYSASLRGVGRNQLPESAVGTNYRSSRSRQHRHHSSKHSKTKREGYEMIIDANETVDGGYLFPQGVYQGGKDFKVSVVRKLIIQRKIAPFYKGLDAVEQNWTDEELLEHVKCDVAPANPPKHGQPGPPTDQQQIWLYHNVSECPICFLVYPRLNRTSCCNQDICTECFVQIKRNPPHPPYTSTENTEATDVLELLSEPAACPYCARLDLGVIFEAPPFEWGIPSSSLDTDSSSSPSKSDSRTGSSTPGEPKPSKSLSTAHPSVVTIDMIRPDWEEKLIAARQRLARKSAAARALHRSALLPRDRSEEGSSWTSSEPSSLSDVVHASRTMTAAQTRALEQRMIDEAIKASLAQR